VKVYESSLSPKGQITWPLELRRRWGLKPNDRLLIQVDDAIVTLAALPSPVEATYGVLPPLPRPFSVEEMAEAAAEEHAQAATREGR
jgi:bifunctional DNA-binding transcriptional regulator/antitoxin component of YhaV-PrlF toxin-antitoxin module